MREIYSSGLLTVTKSPVDDKYTFFADRIPLLMTTPAGALELAEAIIKEEKKEPKINSERMVELLTGKGE